jgi:hypothetical protein
LTTSTGTEALRLVLARDGQHSARPLLDHGRSTPRPRRRGPPGADRARRPRRRTPPGFPPRPWRGRARARPSAGRRRGNPRTWAGNRGRGR